ncbi:MAG: sensor histidine kinase [Anaerolineae bacterium]|nr:sensor histidine kinase [Anaerolineae bacterium]
MINAIRSTYHDVDKASLWTIITVVVIGYVVTFLGAFSSDGYQGTAVETILSIIFGITYVLFLIFDQLYFERFPSGWGTAVYFIIQLSLIYAIHWLIGPGGIWLVSLPLVSQAVEYLTGIWRWLVYGAILFGLMIPLIFRYDQTEAALYFALSVSPAILFVVVFTNMGIKERKARQQAEKLSGDLEAANQQLSQYAIQVEELATIEERNRLAREIHDNLGHYLTVVNVQIGAAKVLMDKDEAKAKEALDKAQNLTQEGLKAVRQSVAALRESPVGQRPLPEAIALLTETTSQAGIVTEFSVLGKPRSLSSQIEYALYRVTQEGLTNVRKHARASRVDVVLDYSQADCVRLEIADNGVGTAVADGGFGLLGIRERVHLLDGECHIETAPGAGFKLTVTIPIA